MIYLGADHNGFWLKEELKTYLQKHKILYKDMGALRHVQGDDYPDYALRVAKKIASDDLGILVCGSGHGMAITANKVKGIRAAVVTSLFSAKKSREDDHANVLVLSSWETAVEKAKRIVAKWLTTRPTKASRHLRRLKKIQRIER